MAVLHPLYFTAGRYTADLDRVLIAAGVNALDTKAREGGVLPPVSSMRPSISNAASREITVQTGMCLIPDTTTAGADSYGLYLAGVDTSTEIINLANTNGTHYVYAEIDETEYVISNKALTTNVATISYVSAAQRFAVGQTIYVRGVDDIFDGSYKVTAIGGSASPFTVSYARTASDVTSRAVTAYAVGSGASDVVVRITQVAVATPAESSTTGVRLASIVFTTESNGFAAGDLITVRGAHPLLDGEYVANAVTGTSFTIQKEIYSDQDIALVSGGIASSRARISGPFNIKSSTTAPSTNSLEAIVLAEVTVSGGSATAIADKRSFIASNGGMHLWTSAAITNVAASATPSPTAAAGRLRYDINQTQNHMEVYDSALSSWMTIYRGADWSHLIDATLTSSTKAAPANHGHAALSARYGTTATSSSIDATIPANTTSLAASWSGKTANGVSFTAPSSGRVLINFSSFLQARAVSDITIASIRVHTGTSFGTGGTTVLSQSLSAQNTIRFQGSVASDTALRQSCSFVVEGLASGTSYSCTIFYYNNSGSQTANANNAIVQVTPMA